LLNYIFAIRFYEDKEYFNNFWQNSLQICGKDNLKFQAYIFQALLLSNNIPQTKELLIHGTILDEKGYKMSKTAGNIIDPIIQKEKFGLSPLKYYLIFGLSLYEDSKYSEQELINLWNNDIVNGFGNLVSRTLHLIDIKKIKLDPDALSDAFESHLEDIQFQLDFLFQKYEFTKVRNLLNEIFYNLNKRFQEEKPFSKECDNIQKVLNEIYFELKLTSYYYEIILKEYKNEIHQAFINNKKVILFKKIE